MLAKHLEWHMRQRLTPMLYHDTDKLAADAQRPGPVAEVKRAPAAAKQTTDQTADGLPAHSWHSLIADLATLVRNIVTAALAPENRITLLTRPTPIQHKALQLLGVAL
ncbi:hypothetical protein ACFQS7_17800 [Dankookia sp. GCM10030260]|uniref:hypothetical protein n=1 Tax=Dankookia sp. GCM10030260 TaxID=3273390 RepID=UPI003615F21A